MTRTAASASELRISVTRLARRLRQQRADLGLGLTQVATLATLDRHGPMTPSALADHERIQPPSMTRILAKLEAAGYVVRTAHPSDGRQHIVAITDTAQQLLREDRRRKDAWLAQRMHELTPEERAVLAQAAPILERLAQA
ncbi:MAG TPA: MarR family transcriptional regulator [Thermomicrobiaceae bacterium]|nr:MarR family transcriptional regulator [Thermomicrobiaceae bacterium]